MANSTKLMSQAELQHLEHCNKALEAHLEIVTAVVNESEKLLNNYLPIVQEYVSVIGAVTHSFAEHVANIYSSSREMKVATGGAQELINFMATVDKLDKMLTPELLEKLRKVSQ